MTERPADWRPDGPRRRRPDVTRIDSPAPPQLERPELDAIDFALALAGIDLGGPR